MEKVFPWIKEIPSALLDLDEIPLLASGFALDFKEFSSALSEILQVSPLEIDAKERRWVDAKALQKEIKEDIIVPFSASPVEGEVFWAMSKEDVDKLTSWILSKETKAHLSSDILREGFYHYILLEALHSLQKNPHFEQFSFRMNPNGLHFKDAMLVVDIQIRFKRSSAWGKLLIPPDFRKNWKQYFSELNPFPFSFDMANQIDLSLGIKIAKMPLPLETLQKLKPGDFLCLESSEYDPKTHLGKGILTLGKLSLFQLKISGGKCEILELISQQEEEANMENPESKQEEATQITSVPFTVTVELSRLRMTLANLMKLEPGNVLDLPTSPEEGVILSVNGKKIGKGELLLLGEKLGVRILEIGK